MSMNIEQPVSTPSHEWAASSSTTDAIFASSLPETRSSAGPLSRSAASSPGPELPGAFPRDALDLLSDAAPTNGLDVRKHIDAAKQRFPAREDIQRTIASVGDTAKSYLPESVVGVLGLPVSTTDTGAVDADPTSATKPSSASIDKASITTLPPSTRSASLQTDFSYVDTGVRTPTPLSGAGRSVAADESTSANEGLGTNEGLGSSLGTTSVLKPASIQDTPEHEQDKLAPSATAEDLPLTDSDQNARPPLSTPPSSDHALPVPPTFVVSGNDFPLPSSRKGTISEPAAQTPPPKDLNEEKHVDQDAAPGPRAEVDQPHVNTSPTQPCVTAGPGVSIIGTSGADSLPPDSPTASHALPQIEKGGHGVTIKSDGTDDREREGKKEGRTRKFVEKIKDKMHHHRGL